MNSTERLDQLTSIRGFAALGVLLFHCQEIIGGFDLRPFTHVAAKGYLGVDFFFILSGFILSYVYARRFDGGERGYGRFIVFRLARIYPLHLATLLMTVPLALAFRWWGQGDFFDFSLSAFLGNLFLVHAWGVFDRLSWNFVSWSISAEWAAYLCFPVVLLLTRPFARFPVAALVAGMAVLLALGGVVWVLAGPGVSLGSVVWRSGAPASRPFDITYNFALLRVGFSFLAGVLLYRVFARWRQRPWPSADFLAAACVAILFLLAHFEWRVSWAVWQDMVIVLVGALFLLFLALSQSWLARICAWRPLVYLGEISYAIYMVHGVGIVALYLLWDLGVPGPGRFITGLPFAVALTVFSLVGGAALYAFVETPARAYLRSFYKS